MYLYFTYREEKVNTVRELSFFNSVSQIDLFKCADRASQRSERKEHIAHNSDNEAQDLYSQILGSE